MGSRHGPFAGQGKGWRKADACGFWLDQRGYRLTRLPGTREVLRVHRLVMEGILGRPLEHDEHVHHRNHNRLDNRPENLQLIRMYDHSTIHGAQRIHLICHNCGTPYRTRASRLDRSRFCSMRCASSFRAARIPRTSMGSFTKQT